MSGIDSAPLGGKWFRKWGGKSGGFLWTTEHLAVLSPSCLDTTGRNKTRFRVIYFNSAIKTHRQKEVHIDFLNQTVTKCRRCINLYVWHLYWLGSYGQEVSALAGAKDIDGKRRLLPVLHCSWIDHLWFYKCKIFSLLTLGNTLGLGGYTWSYRTCALWVCPVMTLWSISLQSFFFFFLSARPWN